MNITMTIIFEKGIKMSFCLERRQCQTKSLEDGEWELYVENEAVFTILSKL